MRVPSFSASARLLKCSRFFNPGPRWLFGPSHGGEQAGLSGMKKRHRFRLEQFPERRPATDLRLARGSLTFFVADQAQPFALGYVEQIEGKGKVSPMGGGHRGIRWSQKDDDLLRDLMAANASETLMRARLKRSPEAIRMRVLVLKKREEKKAHVTPTPELPDPTPVHQLQLPPRIKNVLLAEGLKTVGEVRETSDDTLMSFQDFGQRSMAYLRDKLGSPSRLR